MKRRGFLASLFAAPVVVAAPSAIAKFEATAKRLELPVESAAFGADQLAVIQEISQTLIALGLWKSE